MPFTRYLTPEEVTALKRFFDRPNVSYDADTRFSLRANLPNSYRGRMPNAGQDLAQLDADLDFLNTTERLTDGTVPLKVWLENAAETFTDEAGAEVFRQMLETVERRSAGGSDGAATTTTPAETGQIIEVLGKVWKKIQDDEDARDAVSFYREIFRQALQEIDIITGYKDMHESLHNLKMGWPPDITSLAAALPDPTAQLRLSNLSMFLGGIVESLCKTLARENVKPAPLKFNSAGGDDGGRTWVEELERWHAVFDQAVGDADSAGIAAAFDAVNNNIGPLLSGLNNQLKDAVEVMQLGKLTEALRKVCKELLRLDPTRTAEKVVSYQAGIDELSALDADLHSLKEQHNEWQKVDDRLTAFDDMLVLSQQKRETLDLIHKMLKLTAEPIYAASTEKWAANLQKALREMREALDKQDDNKAGAWFQFYRETAKLRFFELDREMMSHCRELSKVGERLRKIDDELENM